MNKKEEDAIKELYEVYKLILAEKKEDSNKEILDFFAMVWTAKRLVFCKDCMFAVKPDDKPNYQRCNNSNWYMEDNDFCSRGVKREEETEK